LDISTSDYSVLDDKPNKSRAIFNLFSNVVESEGDCDFPFGELGFKAEFYLDLITLYKLENKFSEGYSFYATVRLCTDQDNMMGSMNFCHLVVFKATFTYKDDEEEE
jgi:hypothetical protein